MVTPIIITGPPTDKVSKEEAEAKLVRHPQFPKNASYALEEVEGRWIAAISPKQAAPPEAFSDGGGAGDTPAGPPEPSEAPKGPPEEDVPDDESSEDEKPKGDKDEKGEKGEKGELGEIKELLTLLVTALGLGAGPEDSPIPGADEGPPVPPPGAPPADAPGGDNKTHTVHERALKPGEAPPGTTPIGSPSFAHVRDDHPWKSILGRKRTFKLEEPIGDEPLSAVAAEVHALAAETNGYKVAQLNEARDDSGQRIARVLITTK
jgi:hypothetical protein